MDTGASHYITSNVDHLAQASPFLGLDAVFLRNDEKISSSSIGNGSVSISNSYVLSLDNILHTHTVITNIFLVNKLC